MVQLALALLTDMFLVEPDDIALQLAFVLVADELLVPIALVTLVFPDALLAPIVLDKHGKRDITSSTASPS